MESENKGLLPEDVEQPPLLEPFMEEAGEMKLEIHRVRNRVGVLKHFYQHAHTSQSSIVRRELSTKISTEHEVILASLTKISDTMNLWKCNPGQRGVQRQEVESGVRSQLRDALLEYQEVLNQHRENYLTEIQNLLQVTGNSGKTDHGLQKESQAFVIDQANFKSFDEAKHIEIEERYGELLWTDRTLKNLKLKFSQFLSTTDYTDLPVLQLSNFLSRSDRTLNKRMRRNQSSSRSKEIILMTMVATVTLLGIICLFAF